MRPFGHRRQVLLFVAVMLAPCLALVFLSFGIIRQESELADRRLERQRHQALAELRESLQSRLDRIKTREFAAASKAAYWPCPGSYEDRSVALLARVQDNVLALPWESNPAAEVVGNSFRTGEFGGHIRDGEAAELKGGELDRAVASYRRAIAAASTPHRKAFASWLEARALLKQNGSGEPLEKLRRLLDTPLEYVDDDAVPLALYAADHLLQAGVERKAALAALMRMPSQRPMLSGVACYKLDAILKNLPPAERDTAARLESVVREQIRLMKQASALSEHLAALGITQGQWLVYGRDWPWLVSAGPPDAPAGIIALDAARTFSSAEAEWNARHPVTVSLVTHGAAGEALGGPFPGLNVTLAVADEADLLRRESVRRNFFYVTLMLLAGATSFGAWMLWRDLRREVHVAGLRAQFVSSVSHELKTPLTAIRMFAETLQMRRPQDENTRHEYLDTIVNECVRLSRLVDDILTFSKIERGQKVFHFRPARLDYAVHSAVRAMEYPMAQQGFDLDVRVAAGDYQVRADTDAIEQAVLNLLSNAMKYSGESKKIEIELCRNGGYGIISVTDHGVGIAPEHQGRIFEKYYRAPTRENQLISGAGLGLALVTHIVKAHGGRIDVRSAPGEGSTFQIQIPLEEKS